MQGCILGTTSASYPSNSNYQVPWDSETQFGTESFQNGNLIEIPNFAGTETAEFFFRTVTTAGATSADNTMRIERQSDGEVLADFQTDNPKYGPCAIRTGAFEVSSGDQFKAIYRSFGTTGACDLDKTFFGCIINPQDHLLGMAQGTNASAQNTTSGVVLDWTAVVDTLSTHNVSTTDPDLFTAPTDCVAAVCNVAVQTDSSSSDAELSIRKNGTEVALFKIAAQFRAGWLGAHLIDVTSGDELQFHLTHGGGNTLNTQTTVTIEWYG